MVDYQRVIWIENNRKYIYNISKYLQISANISKIELCKGLPEGKSSPTAIPVWDPRQARGNAQAGAVRGANFRDSYVILAYRITHVQYMCICIWIWWEYICKYVYIESYIYTYMCIYLRNNQSWSRWNVVFHSPIVRLDWIVGILSNPGWV